LADLEPAQTLKNRLGTLTPVTPENVLSKLKLSFVDAQLDAAREQLTITFEGNGADPNKKNVGGIDLNTLNLKLQIKRDDQGIPLPLQFQDVGNINVEGFVPTIIDITPVTNLPVLMGLNDNATQPTAGLDVQPVEKYARLD
jgi:hypothetical protein